MPANWPGIGIYVSEKARGGDGPLGRAAAERIIAATPHATKRTASKKRHAKEDPIVVDPEALAKSINLAFLGYRVFRRFAPSKAKLTALDEMAETLSTLVKRIVTALELSPRELINQFDVDHSANQSSTRGEGVRPTTILIGELHRLSLVAKNSSVTATELQKFGIDTNEAQYMAGRGLPTIYETFFRANAGIIRAIRIRDRVDVGDGSASGPYPEFVLAVFNELRIIKPNGGAYSKEFVARALYLARRGAL